jgi:hypothetical protein
MHENFICQRLSQTFIISGFQGFIEYIEAVPFSSIIFTKFSLYLLAHQSLCYRQTLFKPAVLFFYFVDIYV